MLATTMQAAVRSEICGARRSVPEVTARGVGARFAQVNAAHPEAKGILRGLRDELTL
jgi:hypothetical protein